MGDETKEKDLLSDGDLEKSFNDAMGDLVKAIGEESEEDDLNKAKEPDKKAKKPPVDSEPEEEDEEEEDEDEYKKSIEFELAENEEAEAAMDVEPFLRAFAKSFDEAIMDLAKSFENRFAKLDKIEAIVKSQSKLMKVQAELQKSIQDTTEKIGKQELQSSSVRRLQKSRFETGEKAVEMNGPSILAKSSEWLLNKSISIVEAGVIESRVNKGTLGKVNDTLDKKVNELIVKEAS